jgi:WD40 repeat protein
MTYPPTHHAQSNACQKVATAFFFLLSTLTASADELPLAVATIDRSAAVDFATEIMPLLTKNCLACHRQQEPAGGLVLETLTDIHRGGDSGPGVVANDVAASVVFTRATGVEEPLMPPEDNDVGAVPLTPDELGLLKKWIEQGAVGSDSQTAMPIEFQPLPESLRTIYALDVSPDGLHVAVGQANRISIMETDTFGKVAQLSDESLGLGEVADVDLIQSIAFAPDGRRIASGGFRTVRIWHKQPIAIDPHGTPLANAAGLIAISSDTLRAAIVNAVGDIEIWNLVENTKLHTLTGHIDRVTGLAMATTGDRLISGDQSGRLFVWNVSNGEKIVEFSIDTGILNLALSRDGSHFAAIDELRTVRLFQISDDNQCTPLSGPTEGIVDATAIAFAEQPTPMLIIASESSAVTMRSLAESQIIRSIDHGAVVDALAVSVDQSLLLSGGRDGTAKLWNIADGAAVMTMQGDVQSNLRLATANRDADRQAAAIERLTQQTAVLQERLKKEEEAFAKIGEEQQKSLETLAAQEQTRLDAAAALSATEAVIAKADEETQAAQAAIEAAQQMMAEAVARKEAATKELAAKQKAVADAETAKQATETAIENRKQTIASAEAAKQLAGAAIPEHEAIVAREARHLKLLQSVQAEKQSQRTRPAAAIVGAAFSPAGNHVVTAQLDGDVVVYRSSDGLPIDRFTAVPALDRPSVLLTESLVVGFAVDQQAAVWPRQSEWQLERVIGNVNDASVLSDRVTSIDFRRDGLSIAVGSGPPSRAGEVKIFAVETGEVIRDFGQVHSDTVLGLKFSPAGDKLISAAADKTIRLLNIATGETIRSLEGHTHHVLGVAWQDDGQTVASAGADQTVKVWNVESGQQIRTIAGFNKEVTAVAFLGTSNQLATAGANGQVRINNTADGKPLKNFDAQGDFLYCVAVTPDGTRVLSGGHSGTVWVWNVADGSLIATAK